jgi:hypothetical protein
MTWWWLEENENRTPWAALTALMLVATILRVIGLNRDLWLDEVYTLILTVRRPLWEILTGMGAARPSASAGNSSGKFPISPLFWKLSPSRRRSAQTPAPPSTLCHANPFHILKRSLVDHSHKPSHEPNYPEYERKRSGSCR